MKRIFVLTLVLLTVSVSAHAMTVSQQWSKVYGGDGRDAIYDVIQTTDGGYVALGYTQSFGVGLHNVWLLKLDSNGDILWQKTYGIDGMGSLAHSIKQTSDGGYILCGGFGSYDAYAFLLKLDSNGNISWKKAYDNQRFIYSFKGIVQTSDGEYVAAGSYVLVKLDSTGNIIWAKRINSNDIYSLQQTSDGGYVLAGQSTYTDETKYDFFVLKVDSAGNTIWGKIYRSIRTDTVRSVQQTTDGGYIVAGRGYALGSEYADAFVFKLDSGGNIIWQKAYGDISWDSAYSVKETIDNRYIIVGTTHNDYAENDMWVMQIDINGDVLWQKTYGYAGKDDGIAYQITPDGGIFLAGTTKSFSTNDTEDFLLLKLDSNAEIPGCDLIGVSSATVTDINVQVEDEIGRGPISMTVSNPNITLQNSTAETTLVCYYEDPNDMDGDGIENTPGGTMASSMFLATEDNCPSTPNGPYLGTCTQGNVGSTCISDEACGVGGFCSMSQEDTYPSPFGNNIGDACDCEGNFDCDEDVDGLELTAFLADFGRGTYFRPCINEDRCNGDFICDGDTDGLDLSLFLEDFGRGKYSFPCPQCDPEVPWCVYP